MKLLPQVTANAIFVDFLSRNFPMVESSVFGCSKIRDAVASSGRAVEQRRPIAAISHWRYAVPDEFFWKIWGSLQIFCRGTLQFFWMLGCSVRCPLVNVQHINGGIMPSSVLQLQITGPPIREPVKLGLVSGAIALMETIPVGQSFTPIKGYPRDQNREMVANLLFETIQFEGRDGQVSVSSPNSPTAMSHISLLVPSLHENLQSLVPEGIIHLALPNDSVHPLLIWQIAVFVLADHSDLEERFLPSVSLPSTMRGHNRKDAAILAKMSTVGPLVAYCPITKLKRAAEAALETLVITLEGLPIESTSSLPRVLRVHVVTMRIELLGGQVVPHVFVGCMIDRRMGVYEMINIFCGILYFPVAKHSDFSNVLGHFASGIVGFTIVPLMWEAHSSASSSFLDAEDIYSLERQLAEDRAARLRAVTSTDNSDNSAVLHLGIERPNLVQSEIRSIAKVHGCDDPMTTNMGSMEAASGYAKELTALQSSNAKKTN